MANNLFTKEDFIKNRKQSKPWFGHLKKMWPVGVLIIGGLSAFFILRNNNLLEETSTPIDSVVSMNNSRQQLQSANDTIATDTLTKADVGLSLSKEDTPDAPSDEKESNIKDVPHNNKAVEGNAHTVALSVIRGNYGNNPIRRKKLGSRYQEIQDIVNQLYREGKVR